METENREKRMLHNVRGNKFVKIYEENAKFWLTLANFKLHEQPCISLEECGRLAKKLPNEQTINMMFSIAKLAIEADKYETSQKTKDNVQD